MWLPFRHTDPHVPQHRKDIRNEIREGHELLTLTMNTIDSCLHILNALTGGTSPSLLIGPYLCERMSDR